MSKKQTITYKGILDISDIVQQSKNIQTALTNIKLPVSQTRKMQELFGDLTKETKNYQKIANSGFKTNKDVNDLKRSGQNINQIFKELSKYLSSFDTTELKQLFNSDFKNYSKQTLDLIDKVQQLKTNLNDSFKTLTQNGTNVTFYSEAKKQIEDLQKVSRSGKPQKIFEAIDSGNLKLAARELKELGKYTDQVEKKGQSNSKQFRNTYQVLCDWLKKAEEETKSFQIQTELLNKEIEKSKNIDFKNSGLDKAAEDMSKLSTKAKEVTEINEEVAQSLKKSSDHVEYLKNQVNYFFSLGNSIQLFKRILNSAYETVKDLDQAMTETSVVTDYSVGDMWKQLPEYTKRANEFGATIKDVYEADTLYYQQGLKTEEVIAVSNETLKMARIAGMETAEATDMMTAALRGFSMTIDEVNAKRVNDVYSELAKITASDTEEIATAMTKTASIANSANMEFETTAAFLSQIIETTREAPETAGTALKTVIARFQELKKDPAEIGEVDGEIVDANKVETALNTIDVKLRDTTGQFRDLDDVFLEISSKWSSLDLNTQRYIATIAAGSRQQSRFIAMMDNYGRTMELVEAANNSTGSSQEQFEKTLESLETKANKLKNAWDEFAMGIADNTLIKASIDGLTGLLEVLNKITDVLGDDVGGIAKLALLLTTLNKAPKLFNKAFKIFETGFKDGEFIPTSDFFGKIVKKAGEQGQETAKNFFKSFSSDSPEKKKALDDFIKGYGKDIDAPTYMRIEKEGKKNGLISNTDLQNLGIFGAEKDIALLDEETRSILTLEKATGNLTKEKAEQIIYERVEALLRKKNNTERKKTIIEKYKNAIATMKEKNATLGALVAEKAATAATTAFGLALESLKAASPLIILWGLAKVFQWISNNTPTKKLEQLQQNTKSASSTAEEAKNAYNDLATSLENIQNTQNAFEGLTVGTLEWKKALLEANQQVLELVDAYPSLMENNNLHIATLEDGFVRYTVDEKAVNSLLDEQFERMNNAQAMANLSKVEELQQEVDILEEEINSETKKNSSSSEKKEHKHKANEETVLAQKVDTSQLTTDQEIQNKTQNNELQQKELEVDTYIQSTMNGILSGIEDITSDTKEELVKTITTLYDSEELTELMEKEKKELQLKSINELRSLYKDLFGIEANEELTKDQLKAQIAQGNVAKTIQNKAEELSEGLQSLGFGNLEDEILSAISGNLSIEQFNTLKESLADFNEETLANATSWGQVAEGLGLTGNQLKSFMKYIEDNGFKLKDFTNSIDSASFATDNFSRAVGGDQEILSVLQGQKNNFDNNGKIDLSSLSWEQVSNIDIEVIDNKKWKDAIEKAITEYKNTMESNNAQESINYLKNYEASENAQLQGTLEKAGLSNDEFEYIRQEIKNTTEVAVDMGEEVENQFFDRITEDAIELETNLKSLYDVLDENEDTLSAEGTSDYAKALGEINKQVQELTGAKFTNEEIKENLDLIKKAANGDVEALIELQEVAAKKMIIDLDLPEDEIQDLKNKMLDFVNTDFEVGASLDDEPFINGLQNLVDRGEITQQEMNSILQNMGAIPEVQWVPFKDSGLNKKSVLGKLLGATGLDNIIKVPKITYRATGNTSSRTAAAAAKGYSASKNKSNSSSGSSKDPWENSLDKFYNTLEDINEELRIREKLEKKFAKISQDGVGNSNQLLQNLVAQEASLKRQEALQKKILSGKKTEMKQYLKENSNLSKYATYNWSDNTIEINWGAINRVTDSDKGKEIEDYISHLEELQDSMDEAEDTLSDIEDDLEELKDTGKEEYGELEELVLDAYVSSLEEEIDELEKVYNAIENTNSKLIDLLQTKLDDIRQSRENKKTEDDITKTERRLAYLRQDTSGANALEILELEKSLNEKKEDYTDTLIDQKISELQKQNDIAAQQRERQIELAREQVNWSKETGQYWNEVTSLLKNGVNSNGVILPGKLKDLLKQNAGYDAMSKFQREAWNKDIATIVEMADTWTKNNTGKGLNGKTYKASSTGGGGGTNNSYAGGSGSGSGGSGKTNKTTGGSGSGSGGNANDNASERKNNVKRLQYLINTIYKKNLTQDGIYGSSTKAEVAAMQKHLNWLDKSAKTTKGGQKNALTGTPKLAIDGVYGAATEKVLRAYLTNIRSGYYSSLNKKTKITSLGANYLLRDGLPDPSKTYKKGGIADFTGPAWLDGTKSHPELVLNAQDTRNFIQLKDILSDVMKDSTYAEKGGDNYYEIHIEVDEISNDYDVDKLASKVKKIIANDSMYRNVNAINMLR